MNNLDQFFEKVYHWCNMNRFLSGFCSENEAAYFPMMCESRIRIDKWLWAVRLFKTRTAATRACRSGDVKIGGARVKASSLVRIGDIVETDKRRETRKLRVVKTIERRVGAKLVRECFEELSVSLRKGSRVELIEESVGSGVRRSGRPTKKERRAIEKMQSREAGW